MRKDGAMRTRSSHSAPHTEVTLSSPQDQRSLPNAAFCSSAESVTNDHQGKHHLQEPLARFWVVIALNSLTLIKLIANRYACFPTQPHVSVPSPQLLVLNIQSSIVIQTHSAVSCCLRRKFSASRRAAVSCFRRFSEEEVKKGRSEGQKE